MELNVLVRGQSNAILMMEIDNSAGRDALPREVMRWLGFDGAADKVNLVYDSSDWNSSTAFGGTALIGDWLTARNGNWQQGWTVSGREQALLNEIASLPATQRDDPTAILWLHSEYDSANTGLTTDMWVSAVRFDAQQVRAALGQSAATTPYLFLSAMPYWGTEQGHQAIRLGMERLVADASFGAQMAGRMQDINATYDDWDGNPRTIEYGGGHIDSGDAAQTVLRAARSIAEAFAAYAKPGSPLALAGGNIADEGPQVIRATAAGGNVLLLDVAHDRAAGFLALDPDAANGVGWSVRSGAGAVAGTAAAIVDGDTLRVTFSGALPADGKLFYGYGNGRLAGTAGEGRGNAVYDDQGLPIWVSADGLAIDATSPPPGPAGQVITGTRRADALAGGAGADSIAGLGGNDTLRGGDAADTLLGGDGGDNLSGEAGDDRLLGEAGNDTLTGGAGNDVIATGSGTDRVVFGAGAGADRVTDFVVGTDRVELPGIATATVSASVMTDGGVSGLRLTLAGGETLFLQGVGSVTAAQLGLSGSFAAPPPPPPPPGGTTLPATTATVTGGAGDDWLKGGPGADLLLGNAGSDDLQGLDGNDVLRGGLHHDGLTGGAGNDTFVFARGDGPDWIVDFRPGVEKLWLIGISTAEVTQAVETRWGWVGVAVRFGGGDEIFLQDVGAPVAASDFVFA
jgi:Ca2+-binding RTX toxin-like protein